jgi:MoaE-MoaD fusion protein
MTPESIRVQVRAFAGLREAMGTGLVTVLTPPGSTVAALLQRLGGDYPRARLEDHRYTVTVNRTMAAPDRVLLDGDELALIPPVSGGAARMFEVTDRPLSVAEVAARVSGPDRGGVALFVGMVRGITTAPVSSPEGGNVAESRAPVRTDYLEYEAYTEMAEEALAQIGADVQARWPDILSVAIAHRVGRMEVGDAAVVIAVAAAHRRHVFAACQHAIDRVKEIAPIWKREVGPGGAAWVEGPESAY